MILFSSAFLFNLPILNLICYWGTDSWTQGLANVRQTLLNSILLPLVPCSFIYRQGIFNVWSSLHFQGPHLQTCAITLGDEIQIKCLGVLDKHSANWTTTSPAQPPPFCCCWWCFLFCIFLVTESLFVTQTGLELTNLFLPLKCWPHCLWYFPWYSQLQIVYYSCSCHLLVIKPLPPFSCLPAEPSVWLPFPCDELCLLKN